MKLDVETIAQCTVAIAREAGGLSLSAREGSPRTWRRKVSGNIVTDVDTMLEKFIFESIHEEYPSHSVLGEESGLTERDPDCLWVVDPLDGTDNFLAGLPEFCVSLAFQHKATTLVSAVYCPSLDEMYFAVRCLGAWKNDTRIAVRREHDSTRIIATGFSTDAAWRKKQAAVLEHLLVQSHVAIREPGSASLGLARVASGIYNAYLEGAIGPWDVVPGALLVQEAGGILRGWDGQPLSRLPTSVIATNDLNMHDFAWGAINQSATFE